MNAQANIYMLCRAEEQAEINQAVRVRLSFASSFSDAREILLLNTNPPTHSAFD